jgi:hypothetical protein
MNSNPVAGTWAGFDQTEDDVDARRDIMVTPDPPPLGPDEAVLAATSEGAGIRKGGGILAALWLWFHSSSPSLLYQSYLYGGKPCS